jgi:regulatory protein
MEETGSTTLVSLNGDDRVTRILLSDGQELELATGSLPPALPVPGEVISPELVRELVLASERKTVANLVFKMLDRRLRTRRDMMRKLSDKGFDPEAVSVVLDQFEEHGLHSDRRFAEAWCRDTLRTKAVGCRFLESKLRSKGIASSLAAVVSRECLDPETESTLARRAAVTWWRKQRGDHDDPKTIAKGARFLASRGFPTAGTMSLIRDTVPSSDDAGDDF